MRRKVHIDKKYCREINKNLKETGSVAYMKRNRVKPVRVQENIDRIKEIMRSPQNSTRCLFFQLSIKRTSCQRILKNLKMWAFNITALQGLKEKDYRQRMHYSEWLLMNAADGCLDQHLHFTTDKSWFHFTGCINY